MILLYNITISGIYFWLFWVAYLTYIRSLGLTEPLKEMSTTNISGVIKVVGG